jgi:hypothetical protein
MERGLRLIAVGAFADEMRMALPEFKLWNAPQHYVSNDEVVWKRGSSLVVLGTDPQGERDAVSVSVGRVDGSGGAELEMLRFGLVSVTLSNCGEVAQQLMECLLTEAVAYLESEAA